MAENTGRVGNYSVGEYYSSAAPARAPYIGGMPGAVPVPSPQEQPYTGEKRAEKSEKAAPSVSLFSVFGTVLAAFLMVFVVLAQIKFNEIASETARLNTQISDLQEQGRKLEIELESAIDIKEVERLARDWLGMSRPNHEQITIIAGAPGDSAQIIDDGGQSDTSRSFGSFISSLLDYFR